MRSWAGRHRVRAMLGFGVVVAVAAYGLTSLRSGAPGDFVDLGGGGYVNLSPYAERWPESHFDPWTGQPLRWGDTENPDGLGETTERFQIQTVVETDPVLRLTDSGCRVEVVGSHPDDTVKHVPAPALDR